MSEESPNNEGKDHSLFKSTYFSFLSAYTVYFSSLVIVAMTARVLTPYEWGILILYQSIIVIWIILVGLFPPGLGYSLNYYIPKYAASGENFLLKSLLINSLKLKLISLGFFIIIGLIIVNIISINYVSDLIIIYILLPQIIFSSLNIIIDSIIIGFKYFKSLFLIKIFTNTFHIILFFGLFFYNRINLLSISIVLTLISFFEFIVKLFVVKNKVKEILRNADSVEYKFKGDLKKIINYGTPIVIGGMMSSLWGEIKKQSIGILLDPSKVTIYNIGESLPLVSIASLSIQKPLVSHFSELDHEKEKKKIEEQFILIFKFSLIATCLITGVVFFLLEIYIMLVYGNSYILYLFYFQMILISAIPRFLGGLLTSLLYTKKKVNYIPALSIIFNIIFIISFYLGIFYFQLIGYSYFLIIAVFAIFILQFWLTKKLGNIKLPKKKTIFMFSIFFDSILISYWIINIIFPNLGIFKIILGGFIFFVIIVLQIVISKILNHNDLDILESLFIRDTKFNKVIRNIIKIFKRF